MTTTLDENLPLVKKENKRYSDTSNITKNNQRQSFLKIEEIQSIGESASVQKETSANLNDSQ